MFLEFEEGADVGMVAVEGPVFVFLVVGNAMMGAANLKVPITSALIDGSVIIAPNEAGDDPLKAIDLAFVAVVASDVHGLLHRPGASDAKAKESVAREIGWWSFLVIGPVGWPYEVFCQDDGCAFVGGGVTPCVGVVSHAGCCLVFERRAGLLRFRKSNSNGPILGGLSLSARLMEFAYEDIIFLDLFQETNFTQNSRSMFHQRRVKGKLLEFGALVVFVVFRLLLDDVLEPLNVTAWRRSLKLWKIFLTKFTWCSASTSIPFGLEDLFAVVGFLGCFSTILIVLGGLRRSCRLRRFIRLFFTTPMTDIHVLILTATRT